MRISILIANIIKLITTYTIGKITPTLEDVIETEILKINCPIRKQNYISRVLIDLYNDGELDAAFYISNKYRHDN